MQAGENDVSSVRSDDSDSSDDSDDRDDSDASDEKSTCMSWPPGTGVNAVIPWSCGYALNSELSG